MQTLLNSFIDREGSGVGLRGLLLLLLLACLLGLLLLLGEKFCVFFLKCVQ